MPGLCGLLSLDINSSLPNFSPMLDALSYGRAHVTESFRGQNLTMGCAHLGTGGQRALHESMQAAVVFYGYLTRPAIPPGADKTSPAAAAQHIHDQYLENGEYFLKDITGAFAFALWDKRLALLLAAVDRMGLRPVYYAVHNKSLRFASEVKAILSDPNFPRRLDPVAAAEFFHFRYVMGERTFFGDIHCLPPATYLRSQNGSWRIVPYWKPSYPDSISRRSHKWYDREIYEALKNAVERIVRPDLKYGISLSSGIDSRWIAALLSRVRPDTQTFTFKGTVTSDEEAQIAGQVAELAGLQHRQFALPEHFVSDHAERIAYISDGMLSFVDCQEFPLSVLMGNYVDVTLGGFMGSGFFGHHPQFYLVRPRHIMEFKRRYFWTRLPARCLMERMFGRQNYQNIEASAMESLRATCRESPAKLGFQILTYEDIRQRQRRFSFPAQLLKTPYVDMCHPLADGEVWELSLQLPPGQLVYKRALRRSLARYFPELSKLPWNKIPGRATVPIPFILMYQAYSLAKRVAGKKLGLARMALPSQYKDYSSWMRGSLRPLIEKTIKAPETYSTGLFDPDGLQNVVGDHLDGKLEITSFIGLLLPYIYWTQMFYLPAVPYRPKILTESDPSALRSPARAINLG